MPKLKTGIFLLIIILCMGCGKKEEFVKEVKFQSSTKDKIKLYAVIEVEFETKESFNEFKKKTNEMNRAFGFIFDDYKSDQFDKEIREGQGRGTIYIVMRKIIKSRLSEQSYKSVKRVSVVDYGLIEKK